MPKNIHHHLDRRADTILAAGESLPDDALLSTRELCEWLGVSTQWAEIARHKGRGPKFIKLSPRRVRYRVSDVRRWLGERTHQATKEFPPRGRPNAQRERRERIRLRPTG